MRKRSSSRLRGSVQGGQVSHPTTPRREDSTVATPTGSKVDVREVRGSFSRRFIVDVAARDDEMAADGLRNNPVRLDVSHSDASGHTSSATRSSFVTRLHNAFLPEGYPQSVTPDYLEYQLWDTLQALCSSITGTLSTRSVLRGVGVGSAEATVISSTLSWVLRDGVAMLSRIFFASAVATDLDYDAKRWRYVADITNDIALMIEVFASYLPTTPMFLCAICLASVFKAVTGVAGGGARASLTHHFALRDNTADLSAKEGSQETAAGLAGMLLGMAVAVCVPDDSFWATVVVFVLFSALHLYANYRAVTALVLRYMNRQRAGIVMGTFMQTAIAPMSLVPVGAPVYHVDSGVPWSAAAAGALRAQALHIEQCVPGMWVLTPRDVQRLEGVLFHSSIAQDQLPPRMVLGGALSDLLAQHRYTAPGPLAAEVGASVAAYGYALVLSNRPWGVSGGTYWVFLDAAERQHTTQGRCVLRAVFHAMLHRRFSRSAHGHAWTPCTQVRLLSNPLLSDDGASVSHRAGRSGGRRHRHDGSDHENGVTVLPMTLVDHWFAAFEACAERAGWVLDRAQLRMEGWGLNIHQHS